MRACFKFFQALYSGPEHVQSASPQFNRFNLSELGDVVGGNDLGLSFAKDGTSLSFGPEAGLKKHDLPQGTQVLRPIYNGGPRTDQTFKSFLEEDPDVDPFESTMSEAQGFLLVPTNEPTGGKIHVFDLKGDRVQVLSTGSHLGYTALGSEGLAFLIQDPETGETRLTLYKLGSFHRAAGGLTSEPVLPSSTVSLGKGDFMLLELPTNDEGFAPENETAVVANRTSGAVRFFSSNGEDLGQFIPPSPSGPRPRR